MSRSSSRYAAGVVGAVGVPQPLHRVGGRGPHLAEHVVCACAELERMREPEVVVDGGEGIDGLLS